MRLVLHWLVPVSPLTLLTCVGWLLAYLEDRVRDVEPIAVRVPELSSSARGGEIAFAKYCAECHGSNAAGRPAGPPLIHPLYRSAHHADAIVQMAVRSGVGQHHWRFGDMPPIAAVADTRLEAIVRYVRDLQYANGLD